MDIQNFILNIEIKIGLFLINLYSSKISWIICYNNEKAIVQKTKTEFTNMSIMQQIRYIFRILPVFIYCYCYHHHYYKDIISNID